jgi:hypothetical protein
VEQGANDDDDEHEHDVLDVLNVLDDEHDDEGRSAALSG